MPSRKVRIDSQFFHSVIIGDWWAFGEHRYGDRKALVQSASARRLLLKRFLKGYVAITF